MGVWGENLFSPFSDFVFYLFCFFFSNLFFCLFSLKKTKNKKQKTNFFFLLSIKHIDIGFWDLIH